MKKIRKYFGTDGVRGRVGESPITPDFVMRLGHAAGKVLAAGPELPSGEHASQWYCDGELASRLYARVRPSGRI